MNTSDALRYLDHEAKECRDRDMHEALCLLLPAMLRVLELEPMNDLEAIAFHRELQLLLQEKPSTYKSNGH